VRRPYVIIFSTATLDGKIADPSGYSRLSCEEDFRLQHEMRASVDAVMVGSGTVLADNPRLTVRLARGVSPLRVVVDGRLRTPPTSRVYEVPGKSVLITTLDHPLEMLRPYIKRGVRVLGAGRGRVDLRRALEELGETMGVRRVMVEGGGRLNCALISRGLVDEVRITIAPEVFGAGTGLFHGEKEGCRVQLALHSMRMLCGGWVHLVYRPVYVFE